MRNWRLLSGILTASGLMSAQALEARTELAINGSSGAAFKDECPAGQVLVGLNARRSDHVDQVQIICATIEGNKFGPELHYGPERGGRTGTPLESACRGGTIFEAELAMSSSNRQVSNVQLGCRSLLNGSIDKLTFSNEPMTGLARGSLGMHYLQKCPEGEVATGLRGRADDYVAALGFICDAQPAGAAGGVGGGGGKATLGEQAEAINKGLFGASFETESSLGGKFDIKLEIDDLSEAQRYVVRGTLRNTDIGPQYNGTFTGTMSPNQIGVVQLQYFQPGSGQGGSVVFTFSADGKTVTGDGIHNRNLPFKWNGTRKD